MCKIVIQGRLPGTNEIIDAAKKGRGKYQPYSIMKAEYTDMVAWIAKQMPTFGRVDITIAWYEPNLRRDPDNVAGGQKFLLDGLVAAGVIENDSQRFINSITHKYELDRKNPRIEVEVKEA